MERPRRESKYIKSFTFSSREEVEAYRELELALKNAPIFSGEILGNLGLFLTRASMARILFIHDLYLKILDVPGVIIELGTAWGQNLALFSTFRSIYEPQNISRKIIGFDAFEDFPIPSLQDSRSRTNSRNAAVPAHLSESYDLLLDRILDCHNRLGSRSHIKKHEIIKGDVIETLPAYFKRNPETLISLIYFDLGLYEPTRQCLSLIKDRLGRGSIIGLDHLSMREVPGDSIAVNEVLGYANCRFIRDPRVPYQSYLVVD